MLPENAEKCKKDRKPNEIHATLNQLAQSITNQ